MHMQKTRETKHTQARAHTKYNNDIVTITQTLKKPKLSTYDQKILNNWKKTRAHANTNTLVSIHALIHSNI